MGNLFLHDRLFPTDLLFRNFFDSTGAFQSYTETKPNYPVDIATTDTGLVIEIAAVGVDKKDIEIETTDIRWKLFMKKVMMMRPLTLTIFIEVLQEELLT